MTQKLNVFDESLKLITCFSAEDQTEGRRLKNNQEVKIDLPVTDRKDLQPILNMRAFL